MLNRYKGIVYGLLPGFGAWTADVAMHAHMESKSFWVEFVLPNMSVLFYRSLTIVFGLAPGLPLCRTNKREREFRGLAVIYERFHREVADPAFLIHAKCEELL